MGQPVIQLQNFTKIYGMGIRAVAGAKDINITVHKGQCVGFVGPNGAGKSTTIRAIMGLLSPTSGTLNVMGASTFDELAKVRQHIGYLPSEVNLYGNLTGKQVLYYAADLKKVDRAAIYPLAERLHLDLSKKVNSYSLGNRKKVALINVLLNDPELIILDEPTSGLDPVMQQIFFALLREAHTRGATIFLSSHNLQEIERFCDTVTVIKDAMIVADGPLKSIIGENRKEVVLEFEAEPRELTLAGIANFKTQGNKVKFDYEGDINVLVTHLANHKFKDIRIHNWTLEQVIRHYYEI
ncbi:MAG: ABC transporter ATP-binding protein [Firmicutes bacterium]|nr:ABC transporter ATP-binding protein [Bacillota bacterium]